MPSLDGFFVDNVSSQAEHPYGGITSAQRPDWNRNGVKESWESDYTHETNRQTWRAARQAMKDAIDDDWAAGLHVCNVATWGHRGSRASYPMVYDDQWNGGAWEGATGKSYSPTGFTAFRNQYTWIMERLTDPKFLIVEHSFENDGDPTTTAGKQEARYHLAATMVLGNGYFWSHQGGDEGYTTDVENRQWFEEYDNNGTDPDYLGQPRANANGAVQTAPRWGAKGPLGIWAREFDGGIVILNPQGNGARTLTGTELGGNGLWKRISGSGVNNGALVTTSTTLSFGDVADVAGTPRRPGYGDAIILLRQ